MPQVVAGFVMLGGAILQAGSLALALSGTGWVYAFAQIGLGLILSGVSSALMGEPDFSIKNRLVTIRQPVQPRDIVYGETRKGGTLVFINEANDTYLHLVVALAGHQVEGIDEIYFDDELAVNAAGVPQGRYADVTGRMQQTGWDPDTFTNLPDLKYVFVEKRLGSDTQSALTQLQIDMPAEWTAAHRLRGVAHVHLRLKFNADIFPRGLPNLTFKVRGKNDIYDPRTALSGYTNNPALCVADYMSNDQYGLGLGYGAEDGINEAALIESANICEEQVALDAGGTEDRYACDGVITTDQSPQTVIKGLLSAMVGQSIWRGSDWHIHAGAYRTPTVTLTGDDIREGGLQISTKVTRSDNFNGVKGKFISPSNEWQADDFPAYQSATYLAEDQGREVWRDLTLPFTISSTACQRIAKIVLETQRRQQTVNVQGKLSAYRAASGETTNLTYDRWGFSSKPFILNSVTMSITEEGLTPTLSMRETSPLVYSWTATEEQIYEAAPPSNLPSPFDIAIPGAPVLTESLYVTRDQNAKAKINITWSASLSPFVVSYVVQARRQSDWQTLSYTEELVSEVLDIQPGTWDVRIKAVSTLGVSSAYSEATINAEGLAAAPSALTNLRIQKAGGIAILKWEKSTDLDVIFGGRVLIRHSGSTTPSWPNSVSMDAVDGNTSNAAVPLRDGTYLIRPVDAIGVQGPVISISTKGIQAVLFANVSTLTGETAWSGTKTNCQIDGTSLKITTLTSEGVYLFPTTFDNTTVAAFRIRPDIDVAALNLTATIDDRLTLIDTWVDFDDSEGAEIDVIVEMRQTDDDPAGSPTWSDWAQLDSTEEELRAAQFRARLITSSVDYNVLLSGLSIYIDEVA